MEKGGGCLFLACLVCVAPRAFFPLVLRPLAPAEQAVPRPLVRVQIMASNPVLCFFSECSAPFRFACRAPKERVAPQQSIYSPNKPMACVHGNVTPSIVLCRLARVMGCAILSPIQNNLTTQKSALPVSPFLLFYNSGFFCICQRLSNSQPYMMCLSTYPALALLSFGGRFKSHTRIPAGAHAISCSFFALRHRQTGATTKRRQRYGNAPTNRVINDVGMMLG
nr:hypothetical protein [Pandoravirus massiliensis]